jgi:hypothetical protein
MRGAIPPLLQYAFMELCSVKTKHRENCTLPHLIPRMPITCQAHFIFPHLNAIREHITKLVIMQFSPPSQEILHLLRHTGVHYRVHKSPPLDTTLSQLHSVNILTHCLLTVYHNIILASMPVSPKWCFPFRFFLTNTLYALLISPMRASCPVHLIPLDLTTLIIFGEEYT